MGALISSFYHEELGALAVVGSSTGLQVKDRASITDPYLVPVALLVATDEPSYLSFTTCEAGVAVPTPPKETDGQSNERHVHGAVPATRDRGLALRKPVTGRWGSPDRT